jgi:plasmid segregation protein ParM
MPLNVGIDVGFGNVKGRTDHSKVDFTSLIGEFSPVKFSSGMEGNADPTANMVVEYDGKRWFVGPSALKQSTPHNTIEQSRTVSEEGQILMLGALGLLAGKETHVNLVVGLPVMHYSDLKESYVQQASGTHVFNYLNLSGEVKDRKAITVKNLRVLPQPFGTVFDLILDDSAQIRDKKLASSKIGIIDIGYNTVDLLRADALEYINKRSTSFSGLGMFSGYCTLSELIYKNFKKEIRPEELGPIVQKGTISLFGKLYPIETLKRKAFEITANNIVSRVISFWPDSWDLDIIVITGGGGANLGDMILPELEKRDIRQGILSEDPLFSNVNGYYKCARFSWGG